MSPPRMYHRSDVRFITRRTAQGQFLTLPDEAMEQIAGFCTGLAILRSRVDIHTACWMSNGYHAVVTDHRARCDLFMNELNLKTTLCRNRQLQEYDGQPWGPDGRRGSLWDGQEPSAIKLLDDAAILEKWLYTVLNPVEAGMVDHPSDFEGFIILPEHVGRPLTYDVPGWYFSDGMFKPVTYVPPVPPPLQHLRLQEATDILQGMVDAGAKAIVERRAREGKCSLGPEGLAKFVPWDFPAVLPPRPKVGRPKKAERRDPHAGCDTIALSAEAAGSKVELDVRMVQSFPAATQRPRRDPEPRTKKQRKHAKFKQRYPREFPAQFNPPRFYSTDPGRMERAYDRHKGDIVQYDRCRRAYRDGDHDVVFPSGTVRMRHDIGVRCARAP